MKNIIKKHSRILLSLIMIIVSVVTINVNAAEPNKGSLTIICHEQKNGDVTTNPVLKGIKYVLYKVEESTENTEAAESYINSNSITGETQTTNDSGMALFQNLDFGRYYAKVTEVPNGAVSYESFLVDIPRTNAQGSGFIYDVTVEPKIKTAYGSVEVTKLNQKNEPVEGVSFKLTKATYNVRNDGNHHGYTTTQADRDNAITLTTDKDGKIKIENLTHKYEKGDIQDNYGVYLLEEVSVPDGYILTQFFTGLLLYVDADGVVHTNYSDTLHEIFQPFPGEVGAMKFEKDLIKVENEDILTKITWMNDKPTIDKKVQNKAGNLVDTVSMNSTDNVTFKITADLPKTIALLQFDAVYKISDTIASGLTLDTNSIVVEGTTDSGVETIASECYTITSSATGLEFLLKLDSPKLYVDDNYDDESLKYKNIMITYNAKFNQNFVVGGDGNINTATLEYSTNKDENQEIKSTTEDTTKVLTGGLKIFKADSANIPLQGAKFKIAASEADARAKTFIKGANGEDIEVTSGADGYAVINGLAYNDDETPRDYWLVETQTPTFEEDGEQKPYSLLRNPVRVSVGKTSHTVDVKVVNRKPLNLPLTGGIGAILLLIVGVVALVVAKSIKRNRVED